MRYFIFVGLTLLVISGGISMSGAAEERFVQDRFAISFWVDPPAGADLQERYKEIADANFNVVLGGFGATTPEQVATQLKLCKKHDMKAIVSLPGYRQGAFNGEQALAQVLESDKFRDTSACWGYMLRDEPNTGQFPPLSYMVDHLRKSRPGKLAYINLNPNYANAMQLGAATYEEYVERYLNEVKPDMLCMDHYPFMTPGGDSRDNYCKNLEVFRKCSMEKSIPFWNFFNTMPFGPHSDPTEAQLRWQIYASLAYGAKGVLYFCYWTPPPPGEFPKGGAIITNEGKRTRHYEQARRINAALLKLGPTLMQLTSTSVLRFTPKDAPASVLAGSPIESIDPGDYLIGVFKHSDGRRAVLLNNYDFSYTAWPTVKFDVDDDKVMEIDQETGKEVHAVDDSPWMPGLQLSLDSGAGRLFLLP